MLKLNSDLAYRCIVLKTVILANEDKIVVDTA